MRAKLLSKRFAIIIFVIIITLIFGQNFDKKFTETNDLSDCGNDLKFIRKLLSEDNGSRSEPQITNCTTPAIENFPYIPKRIRQSVFMTLFSCLVIIYFFIGTALICDQFFVPSLEVICDKFKLESDIAGSTFMAAGSSAPELATSLIGVFVAKDDIGIGTVVGSAVFNIAFVISICALFAGRVVQINWWPIVRDSVFYLISICVLFIAMFDSKISVIESIVFLVVYFTYILFICYNKAIETQFFNHFHCSSGTTSDDSLDLVAYKPISETERSDETASSSASDVECIAISNQYNTSNTFNEDLTSTLGITVPVNTSDRLSAIKRIFNLFNSPLNAIHRLTVPDCRQENRRKWFGLTFFMSCVWISIYSYLIVWMITVIGFNLRIPDTVMGLVFIAGGASIPDAVASLIVVREGLGDMALTNAIASNVFDILVCLGLPWLLKTALIDPGSHVNVISKGLEYSTLSLLSTVVFFLVVTHLNGWKLSPKYGLILMVWYLLFMVMASLYELNVFGQLNPPVCLNAF